MLPVSSPLMSKVPTNLSVAFEGVPQISTSINSHFFDYSGSSHACSFETWGYQPAVMAHIKQAQNYSENRCWVHVNPQIFRPSLPFLPVDDPWRLSTAMLAFACSVAAPAPAVPGAPRAPALADARGPSCVAVFKIFGPLKSRWQNEEKYLQD